MINQELVNAILSEISDLEQEFQKNQGMILTEDDLKCHLFSKIKAIIPQALPTFNPLVTGSPVHSEVKFFAENGSLKFTPDITIISPENLSIFHSIEFKVDDNGLGQFEKYSSKSYEFGGDAILIELKFCRNKKGLSNKNISDYLKDIDKIRKLREIVSNRSKYQPTLFGICAIFNKTDIGREKFDAFLRSNNANGYIYLLYKTGNVDFRNEGEF
jgi:hypothetical protein